MNEYLTALFLGFIEGLTEFIPVSSTAHLVILTEGLKFPAPPGHVFEVFIQIGAIMAVIVMYLQKFWHMAIGFPRDAKARHFAYTLILGTIPALVAGFLLRDFIKGVLYTPPVIASALILGGLFILLFEKRLTRGTIKDVDTISLKKAVLIGCFQTIALIPGVSRSGATIMGGLGLGLSRKTAAEFSFFLAVPVMIAAVGYDTFKSWEAIMAYDHFTVMLAGASAAFVTALLVIKTVLRFIERNGFAPFGWYRIMAGIAVFVIFGF